MEQRELASHAISHHLEPVCPRDDHKMKFDEEPAVNTLQCPIHNNWLYRRTKSDGFGFEWRCGCEGCDYCHVDVPGNWLRQ
jgi:hypothetical protein